ncbi:hypothetical protein MASR2M44_05100 [Bacteroidota bacterium]
MRKIILLYFLVVLVGSCKKDIDLNKFNDLGLNSEFAVPLAIIDLKMNDLVKPDSNIQYMNDGLIKFFIREENLTSFPVDSFVKLPELPSISSGAKLGEITIGNTSTSDFKTLNDMKSNFSPATQNALNQVNGTVTIFPAITDNNSTITTLSLPNADFNTVDLSNGYLVMSFQNKLPVTIDVTRMNLYSMIPFQTLIGQLVFRNIGPNSNKLDSINLAGKTLSSSLGYSLPEFKTFSSPSPVLVNLNDTIRVSAFTRDVKAISGEAIFPSQTINPQTLNVNIATDDPSVRVKHVQFKAGKINYTLKSTIRERLNLIITLNGATKNGSPYPPISLDVNNETKSGFIDISGLKLDLTLDPQQPHNKVKVQVEPRIVSSGQMRQFDSSDFVDASFAFANLEFDLIDGYLGEKVIPVNGSEVDVPFLSDFERGVNLADPRIKIITTSDIGIPIKVAIAVTGRSKAGATQPLNGPAFIIPYPQNASDPAVSGDFTFSKNNSDIVKMLALPPSKVSFTGSAQPDVSGTINRENDFIRAGSKLTVGYEMEMPFDFSAQNFVLSDTTDNPFFAVNTDGTLGNFLIEGIKLENIDFLELIIKMENGFPFDGDLYLGFADKNAILQDSVQNPQLIKSAVTDSQGKVTTKTVHVSTLKITQEELNKMKNQNLSKLIFRFGINTYNGGTTPVKVYSDYSSKIGLSAKVKLKNFKPLGNN